MKPWRNWAVTTEEMNKANPALTRLAHPPEPGEGKQSLT